MDEAMCAQWAKANLRASHISDVLRILTNEGSPLDRQQMEHVLQSRYIDLLILNTIDGVKDEAQRLEFYGILNRHIKGAVLAAFEEINREYGDKPQGGDESTDRPGDAAVAGSAGNGVH